MSRALLDVRRMSEADELTVAAGTSGIALMENAGASVAREIVPALVHARPLVVLCGPGNNGGDGFVVARHLSEAGWPVTLALLGTRDRLAGEARHHADRWTGPIETLTPAALDGSQLVVDALFGAGLSRALEGAAAEVLAAAAKQRILIVAIDVPSGVMGDSGESLGAVAATLTVTFFRKKPGHLLMPGCSLCGEVVVTDIGTPASVLDTIAPDTFENDPSLWLADIPRPMDGENKYTRGHALIWGGYPMTGAPRMAARAAARTGAGLTTIAVTEVALPIYATALTSIMVRPIAMPKDLDDLLRDHRLSGLAIGPGAGIGAQTRERALAMLATGRPTLLDADAITSFTDDPAALFRSIIGSCVITPHEGEFRRLFDATGYKLERARKAARRSGAVIVLKGSDTVIASPAGLAVINANAPATLATAGSGDVLSGIILGLLAQGVAPFQAACIGVWLHGAAAADFGPGLIAEDLPDPAARRPAAPRTYEPDGAAP